MTTKNHADFRVDKGSLQIKQMVESLEPTSYTNIRGVQTCWRDERSDDALDEATDLRRNIGDKTAAAG